ncbi:MAG: phosphatidate phosphatase App1 family protein [Limisphaerales bacterium]
MRVKAFFLLVLLGTIAGLCASPLKPDETVIFFPSHASRISSNSWRLDIRGWIFEPERRPGVATAFRKALSLDQESLSREEQAILASRTKLFLVDSERNKRLSIEIGDKVYQLTPSDDNGHFRTLLEVAAARMPQLSNNIVSFRAVTQPGDERIFTGIIYLVEPQGLTVVSDIDDTIKITEVLSRRSALLNTFAREFRPVPGMTDLYRRWAADSAIHFHYLSASPGQLYPPLAEFLQSNRFPPGSVHLRAFDSKKEILRLTSPTKYKPFIIEDLLLRYPERRFVLVGDSGEMDPEIYGDIARKYPGRVEKIFIRDVTGERGPSPRYAQAFQGVAEQVWEIFVEPGEISWSPAGK